jgi:hypothetical protein
VVEPFRGAQIVVSCRDDTRIHLITDPLPDDAHHDGEAEVALRFTDALSNVGTLRSPEAESAERCSMAEPADLTDDSRTQVPW